MSYDKDPKVLTKFYPFGIWITDFPTIITESLSKRTKINF